MSEIVASIAGVALRTGLRREIVYVAVLAGVSACSFAAFAYVGSPIFDPGPAVDPWLYLAAFTNLAYVYQHWGSTYYVSRLPWIIPGHVAYSLFPPHVAYYVLNFSYFMVGAVFLALLVRRFFGTEASVVSFAVLISSPIYWAAHYWDYVDGPELTYLFAMMYFLLCRPRRRSWGLLFVALGGFFAAAAVTTQLYATLFVVSFAVVIAAVEARRPIRAHTLLLEHGSAFLAGVLVLQVICGTFSMVHGQSFLFFMPQVRYLSVVNPASYRNPNYDWGHQPEILVPLFLLVVLAVAVIRRSASLDIARRMALGSGAFLLITYAVLAWWEFLDSGTPFELPDRFVQLDIAMVPVAGAIFAYVVGGLRPSLRRLAVALAVAAAIVPLVIVYWGGPAPIASGGLGMRIALVVFTLATLAVVAVRLLSGRFAALAVAAAVTVVFGVNWALAASHLTDRWFNQTGRYLIQVADAGQVPAGTRVPTRELLAQDANPLAFDLGLELMHFLRAGGFQSPEPFFWYNQSRSQYLEGVQSLYYYSYSYIGVAMPRVNADFRNRMKIYRPDELVLLCPRGNCLDAFKALRRGGYRYRLVASKRLDSGPEPVWVHVLRAAA